MVEIRPNHVRGNQEDVRSFGVRIRVKGTFCGLLLRELQLLRNLHGLGPGRRPPTAQQRACGETTERSPVHNEVLTISVVRAEQIHVDDTAEGLGLQSRTREGGDFSVARRARKSASVKPLLTGQDDALAKDRLLHCRLGLAQAASLWRMSSRGIGEIEGVKGPGSATFIEPGAPAGSYCMLGGVLPCSIALASSRCFWRTGIASCAYDLIVGSVASFASFL